MDNCPLNEIILQLLNKNALLAQRNLFWTYRIACTPFSTHTSDRLLEKYTKSMTEKNKSPGAISLACSIRGHFLFSNLKISRPLPPPAKKETKFGVSITLSDTHYSCRRHTEADADRVNVVAVQVDEDEGDVLAARQNCHRNNNHNTYMWVNRSYILLAPLGLNFILWIKDLYASVFGHYSSVEIKWVSMHLKVYPC